MEATPSAIAAIHPRSRGAGVTALGRKTGRGPGARGRRRASPGTPAAAPPPPPPRRTATGPRTTPSLVAERMCTDTVLGEGDGDEEAESGARR